MAYDWQLTFRGVRGSFPNISNDFRIYGGNTACISALCGRTAIVLDAGSGLSCYAREYDKEKSGGRINILISHYHIDHLMGLFYFQPLFDPDVEVHFYGDSNLTENLLSLIRRPYWPIELNEFSAKIFFHKFNVGSSFDIDGVHVDTFLAVHPGGSTLYRLTGCGKTIIHALDCEMTDEMFTPLTDFCRDSDIIIWDANFSSDDLRPGWGHSTWQQGLKLRKASGAGRIIMSHYNQNYTDRQLAHKEEEASLIDPHCCFAKEGMVINI